ncbi:hypothetical protein OG946_23810 [Streptomyces sp. NBC_01808]|uniref:hypothetical protein n=1 Tax=Streptomyces sp. NBC_01808 TaxID=2975947 RepID=UPI002DD920DD|nr:hypothetical protein [Streptomyces sp. NBC_01808]WSA40123.1 hypothetical protein OG946_23810 [Streptomyces sp. NBC_01808]
MRIRMLARSLAVSAVVVGLAGAGAASAQASAHPKSGKPCCSKSYYNKSFNKIHKENNKFHKSFNKIHKTWNKVDVDVDIENKINSRVSGNKYTEISPSATVVFGPLQSFNR